MQLSISQEPSILNLLNEHGIHAVPLQSDHEKYLVMDASSVQPGQLRSLGFRLGRGINTIQYFVYHHGQFCGVIR